MQLTTGYENRRARVEIVPLIDVVFLLLVFFIYAMLSMTIHRGVEVQLPMARGEGGIENAVVIALGADNRLSIDGQVLDMEAAVEESAARSAAGARPVLIRGDRAADLGIAIELLARLREDGIEAVSFQVQDSE
ncbi:MAG: biopolymer transporter ExbD [Kiritimatiellae bacterium]|nr:biopolymer transporter ExbD [Kiritimatiellia bacterium]